MDQERLLFLLNSYFNKEELDTLSFELGVDYRKFSHSLLEDRIPELLQITEQENQQTELIKLIRQKRPFLFEEHDSNISANNNFLPPSQREVEGMDQFSLFRLVSTQFPYAEIQAICIDLEIDEKELYGRTKPAIVREMIVILQDRGHIFELKQRLSEHFSGEKPILPHQ